MTRADSPIYRDLMRFKPEGWTANAWAVAAGVSRTVWTDMRRHGNPSRRTLEKLLAAAGSSLAEFEALRIGEAPADESDGAALSDRRAAEWRPAPTMPLPLIATRAEGFQVSGTLIEATELDFATIIEKLPRPASLAGDKDAYAIAVVTDSMWPRFRQGRRVAVSPAAAIAVGDDILVTIRRDSPSGKALAVLGELVDRGSGQVELRQFKPDSSYAIAAGDLIAVHKIIGELI